MLTRIITLISFLSLIAAIVYLFNFSIEELKQQQLVSSSKDIINSRYARFISSFTQKEQQELSNLPCKKARNCPEVETINNKISEIIRNGSVIYLNLINREGVSILNGNKIDKKYMPLLSRAKKNGQVHIVDKVFGEVEDKRLVISFVNLQSQIESRQFPEIYGFAIVDDIIKAPDFKSYMGLALIIAIPLSILFFLFVRRDNTQRSQVTKYDSESSRLRRQIEKLKVENVQQSQFLANFTHELRTPLNSVIGFSGLLKDETLGPLGNSEYIKYAADINNSGVHLLSLINDILDYTKAEVGRLKVNVAEVDISKVIKQCLAIVSPRASESGVELLQSMAEEHHILMVDAKRLKQVLLNILSNAVKFTPEGGSVKVSVYPGVSGDRLFIEIMDTGVGIDEKDLPTVLSLFGQVETNLSRKYEGTGIGLPFAKKLTNLMGGTFEISSKLGMGTRVTLGFAYDKKLNAEYQEMSNKKNGKKNGSKDEF